MRNKQEGHLGIGGRFRRYGDIDKRMRDADVDRRSARSADDLVAEITQMFLPRSYYAMKYHWTKTFTGNLPIFSKLFGFFKF